MIVRVGALVFRQIGSAGDDQPARVDKPTVLARLRCQHSFLDQRRCDQIADADAGFARAEEQDALIGQ